MSRYEAFDFSVARVAINNERSVARRIDPRTCEAPSDPNPEKPWLANKAWLSDAQMAENGWTPILEVPTLDTQNVHAINRLVELVDMYRNPDEAEQASDIADGIADALRIRPWD